LLRSNTGVFTVRLVAVIPWITLLFTVIAAIVLFVAASRNTGTTVKADPVASTDAEAVNQKEKVEEKEVEKERDVKAQTAAP
jgi:hypothetical protein